MAGSKNPIPMPYYPLTTQEMSEEVKTIADPQFIWKEKALQQLKSYYLNFGGIQWFEFRPCSDEMELLVAKICYSLYGPPQTAKDNYEEMSIENAYDEKQKEAAIKIKEKIHEIAKAVNIVCIRVGFIFIACKMETTELLLPVFRVATNISNDPNDKSSKYIDTSCRVYKDWNDWITNNQLPEMLYCYPTYGFFSCSPIAEYEFDSKKDPNVTYGQSPACKLSTRIYRKLDVTSAFASLGAGGVGIAALYFTFPPAALLATTAVGFSAAAYGLGRSVERLVDKGTHKESLTDIESLACWLAIVATPANFATSFVNGAIARGAQQSGRIFSTTTRTFVTLLNFTTIGIDGSLLLIGLTNLIQKYEDNNLSKLDVLQFSMSIFFFSSTLMQPKTANGIIKKAQQDHIKAYGNSLNTETAQKTFQKLADENLGNDIKANSKLVRTINKIKDPDAFFKGVGETNSQVKLGNRKGTTVILKNGKVSNRVNPNRVFFDSNSKKFVKMDIPKFQEKIAKAYGTSVDDIGLNGTKIFENLSEKQYSQIGKAMKSATRGLNPEIIRIGHSIAEQLGLNSMTDLLCVFEILYRELSGKKGPELAQALQYLNDLGRDGFIDGIKKDIAAAILIARGSNLTFESPLKAAYHFRKHGADFAKTLPTTIETYLNEIPKSLFNDNNLVEMYKNSDGIMYKTYSMSDGRFGVLKETADSRSIATIFSRPKYWQNFLSKLQSQEVTGNTPPASLLLEASEYLAASMGLAGILIKVSKSSNSKEEKLEEYLNSSPDPDVCTEISRLLMTLKAENDCDSEGSEFEAIDSFESTNNSEDELQD